METVSKEEQEIRDRIVKCMCDYFERRRWCLKEFVSKYPTYNETARELFEKCHKAVLANIELEDEIKWLA